MNASGIRAPAVLIKVQCTNLQSLPSWANHGSGAIRRPHRVHPGALSRRQLVVAGVVAVVHVVVDRVEPGQRAGVATRGATRGRRALRRRVADAVVGAGAPALEGVVEPEPVTSLVARRLALVVVRGRSA